MEKKYELVKEDATKVQLGEKRNLYRIRALRDFGDVKKGDLGGYIEKEENLSHDGNCWVHHTAKVYDDAEVSGNAKIEDYAKVFDSARVYGSAIVRDEARIYGEAKLSENVVVSSNAEVYGEAKMYGDAILYGEAQLYEDALLCGDADVSGMAEIYGDARVYGLARVYGFARIHEASEVYGAVEICGEAEICGDANISGSGEIRGKAKVCGNAEIYGSFTIDKNAYIADAYSLMVFVSIGSECGYLTAFTDIEGNIICTRGCFLGSLDEFREAVIETHGNNKYAKEYHMAIEMIKNRFEKKEVNENGKEI